MPDKLLAVAETVSIMPWSQYGTRDTYVSSQTSAQRAIARGRCHGWSAPTIGHVPTTVDVYDVGTAAQPVPANTTGTFPALTKQGAIATVGTGALAHSQQTSTNLRLAYDVSPLVQATYSLGIWNNIQISNPETWFDFDDHGPADPWRVATRTTSTNGIRPISVTPHRSKRHQGRI
jgi:iron complex outermembrane receptor protein